MEDERLDDDFAAKLLDSSPPNAGYDSSKGNSTIMTEDTFIKYLPTSKSNIKTAFRII